MNDLSDLVSPLSPEEFRQLLNARVPKLIRGNDAARYASLLNWDGLMEIVLAGGYPPSSLRLTQRGAKLPRLFYQHDGQPKANVITQTMEAGGSIVFYGIDPFAPAMGRLGAAIAEETGEKVVGSAIASTGPGGALPPHYDDTDLIVLQVEGCKRWLIQGDPVPHPVTGMPLVKGEPDAPLILDETLEPGDWLFVPGGYRHQCETVAGRSLHIGFFLYPLTAPRALDLLKREMLEADAERAPFRFEKAGEMPDIESRLKQMLIERIERSSLTDLLAEHRRAEL